jgi:hypothetical protein
MNGKNIDQSPLDKAKTDLEDTQVTAIVPVYKMTEAAMDRAATNGYQPDIHPDDCERETRQA